MSLSTTTPTPNYIFNSLIKKYLYITYVSNKYMQMNIFLSFFLSFLRTQSNIIIHSQKFNMKRALNLEILSHVCDIFGSIIAELGWIIRFIRLMGRAYKFLGWIFRSLEKHEKFVDLHNDKIQIEKLLQYKQTVKH